MKKCLHCNNNLFVKKKFYNYIVFECNNCGYIQLSLNRLTELFKKVLIEKILNTTFLKKNKNEFYKKLILNKYKELTNFEKIINNKNKIKLLNNNIYTCDKCKLLLSYYNYVNIFNFYYCSYDNLIIFSEESFNKLIKYILKNSFKSFYWLRLKQFIKTLIWKENE